MKLSMNWLSELVEIQTSPAEYAAKMTMSGSKVETVEYLGAEIENVVVGRVESIIPHPDADKLRVAQVDVGAETVQIVTGAANVSAGDFVPVALDGAKLPGGVEIRAGTLRGVASRGMLCSHQELGLTAQDVPGAPEHGILLLNDEKEYSNLELGRDIRGVLGFDDHVVDFEITPNRPDCLSVIGLARESAATYGLPLALHQPKVRGGAGQVEAYLSVGVEDPALCPRYSARLVRNVRVGPSPRWMRERLRAAGVRPINNIVDITNYVMLEYGQPMHAFDYACLEDSRIIVRRARPGETLQTLDEQPRQLAESMLVIADGRRPVGVAGVMGGANSEITGNTRHVVFESANFSGVSIRLTARALGMRTEASGRLEKGLDPRNTLPALERACELVELLDAGDVCDGVIDIDDTDRPPRRLPFEPEKINRLLGIAVSREEMLSYLAPLGFAAEGENLVIPSWRADVEQTADIAEEVARLYGYDKIPSTLFAGRTVYHRSPEIQFADLLEAVCVGLGFDGITTYSFIGQKALDRVRLGADAPERRALALKNPLSEDMKVMRTTPLPSMLEVLARNYNVKNESARLFERMKLFWPVLKDGEPDTAALPEEREVLVLGAYGNIDFYGLKAAVEGLAAALRLPPLRYAPRQNDPSFHPGRCAEIAAGDAPLGVLGQVHPEAAESFALDTPAYVAVLDIKALAAAKAPLPQYRPLPRFPGVSRDLAVVCDEAVPAALLEDCIRAGVGELLERLRLFDIYRGAQVAPGKKSVAYQIDLRDPARTLTAEEADAALNRAVKQLADRTGAVIRG